MKKRIVKIIAWTLGSLAFLFFTVLFVKQLKDCQRYARVYRNPVVVEAEVSRHERYEDSDGNVSYYSYIDYVLEEATYFDIRYQSASSLEKLHPVGSRVQVAVNPENHGELMKNVSDAALTIALGATALMIFAHGTRAFRRRHLSKGIGTADSNTVHTDLCIVITGRALRIFWMLLFFMLISLCTVYPMLFGTAARIIAVVCGVFWLYCICRAVCEWKMVQRQEYRVVFDHLVDKKAESDSDGDWHYTFYFVGADRNWEKNVSKTEFETVARGTKIQAVYFKEAKSPFLHYDLNGNACD